MRTLLMLLTLTWSLAQAGWVKKYSCPSGGCFLEIKAATRDGGVIGTASIADSDDDPSCADSLIKLDAQGEILWQKYLGASSLIPTRDGGYLVVRGEEVLKLDGQGEEVWHKRYQVPSAKGNFWGVAETNLGYLVWGSAEEPETGSVCQELVCELEQTKHYKVLLALDANGQLLWQKTLGNGGWVTAVAPSQEGEVVLAGSLEDGKGWLFKLNGQGQVLWSKTYAGEDLPGGSADWLRFSSLAQDPSGGWWVAGGTFDFLTISEEDEIIEPRGVAWLAKLDAQGDLLWRRRYAELPFAFLTQIAMVEEGFVILGAGKGEQGPLSLWLAKLNLAGEIVWQKVLGYSSGAGSLVPLADGSLVVSGFGWFEDREGWVARLEPDGSLPECTLAKTVDVHLEPAPLFQSALADIEVAPLVLEVSETRAQISERLTWQAIPVCPLAQAFASCQQLLEAGKAHLNGVYPIVLNTPQGPELLGARCEMQAYGGGWTLIAKHAVHDPRPPAEFVTQRFGEYEGEGSFSIWPVLDWSSVEGQIGISWLEGDSFEVKASLLEALSSQELNRILLTSPVVNAWVR